MSLNLPADARRTELGIAFFDLAHFARWAVGRGDEDVAAFLHAFYEEADRRLHAAGVRIVKFMGDAGLAVFAPEHTGIAVEALRALGEEMVAMAEPLDLDTDLTIKVHVGQVMEGTFGPGLLARYDVVGRSVNETALLPGRGLVLSPAAYERLPAVDRKTCTWDDGHGVWRG